MSATCRFARRKHTAAPWADSWAEPRRMKPRLPTRAAPKMYDALCHPKSGTASLTVPMSAFMAQGDVLMMPYT